MILLAIGTGPLIGLSLGALGGGGACYTLVRSLTGLA
jgi:hypothetical protein